MVTTRRRLLAVTAGLAGVGLGSRWLADGSGGESGPLDGWPMARRDPAGRSHAPDASPPTDGVAVRWKRSTGALGGFAYKPTPVVSGGWVYAVGERLLALDAATGSVRFRAGSSPAPVALAAAEAYRSPTLAAVGSGVRGFHADGGSAIPGLTDPYRWTTGGERSERTPFGFGGRPAPPVAADGTLFVSTAGGLLAVDASSGRVRWRVAVDGRRPVVRGGTVYVADYGRGVLGYDVDTGDRTFRAAVPGTYTGSLTAGPEELLAVTDDGLAGLGYDGRIRWRYEPAKLHQDGGSVALAGGVAFVGFDGDPDGVLVAVDVADGTERWRSPVEPAQSPRFAPPAVAAGVVYVPVQEGGLAALDAADGSVRWRFTPGDGAYGPWSPVAVAGDRLYAVGNGAVYALEEP